MDDRAAQGAAPAPRTFRLGIALAGGVSTGCYIAGVLDFIVEALDTWAEHRAAGDPQAPPHRVVLTSIAGTSAGAETAALLATVLRRRFPHVRLEDLDKEPPNATQNPLYAGWVQGATAHKLLGDKDWSDGSFHSLLDGTCTDVIAEDARRQAQTLPEVPCRRWLAEPLRMSFTVTSVDGVLLSTDGAGPASPVPSYRNHADVLRFALTGVGGTPMGAPTPEERALSGHDPASTSGDTLKPLTEAAAASGALPVLLPQRVVEWPAAAYQPVRVPLPFGTPPPTSASFWPRWKDPTPWPNPRFVAADGGLLLNDPVDIVRDNLFRSGTGGLDEPMGNDAMAAVLLVQPLLQVEAPEPPPAARHRGGLPHSLLLMLADAVRRHARVSAPTLALGLRDDVFSRYLITPTRPDDPTHPTPAALASSSVGAFGGYLDVAYRRHDYQLGRHNAQRALKHHLTLPKTHALFTGWTAGHDGHLADGRGGPRSELPIIPLLGTALNEPERLLPWPAQRDPTKNLEVPIGRRMTGVVKGLLGVYLPRCWLLRVLAMALWRLLFARKLRQQAVAAIRRSLHGHGL